MIISSFPFLLTTPIHLLPASISEEESLWIRRIIECWKEKDLPCAKLQIEEFLACYPHSSSKDPLLALMGDLYCSKEKFLEALSWYRRISTSSVKNAVRVRKWHCYYQLQQYSSLMDEIRPLLANIEIEEEAHFYFAEACLRQALSIYNIMERKEESIALMHEAQGSYRKLLTHPKYSPFAKAALAECHRLQGEWQEASRLYSELINERPFDPSQEELYYHAALSYASLDAEHAIAIFSTLAKQGRSLKQKAAVQWVNLLIKTERHKDLFEGIPFFSEILPPDQCVRYLCFLAHLKEQKNKFDEACALYHSASCNFDLIKADLQAILLGWMTSAYHAHLSEQFEIAYRMYEEKCGASNPLEPSLLQAKAFFAEKRGDYEKALSILHPLSHFEPALLQKAQLLLHCNRFDEARACCLKDVETCPHPYKRLALAKEISYKKAQSTHSPLDFATLAEDIERLRKLPEKKESIEARNLASLEGSALLKAGSWEKARDLLENAIEEWGASAEMHVT